VERRVKDVNKAIIASACLVIGLALPLTAPATESGLWTPKEFHIIRHVSAQKQVEAAQWVVTARRPQYRIGYGRLPESGRPSSHLPFVLYSRVASAQLGCQSGWTQRRVTPGTAGDGAPSCLQQLRDEPLLAGVMKLLGERGRQVVQLRAYLSALDRDAAGPGFEFWFRPALWGDLEFHQTALERLRALGA
jgi:hypothetical protein